MKKLMTIAILLLGLGASAQAQPAVSAAILGQFSTMYADAEDAEWEEDGDNYLAYFTLNENFATATFSKAGKWVQTVIGMSEKDLPKNVLKTINGNFSNFSYNDVEKTEKKDSTQFNVEIETETKVISLILSSDGKILKKTVEEY